MDRAESASESNVSTTEYRRRESSMLLSYVGPARSIRGRGVKRAIRNPLPNANISTAGDDTMGDRYISMQT